MWKVIGVAVEFETSDAAMILKGNLSKDLIASGYYRGTSASQPHNEDRAVRVTCEVSEQRLCA